MRSLGKFLEPIKIAGKLINKDRQAYRMDGEPDMRTESGLGACDCCDYFSISATTNRNVVILIEETDLTNTTAQLEQPAKNILLFLMTIKKNSTTKMQGKKIN